MIKPFWQSKTVLINVVAGVALFFFGMPEVGAAPELVAGAVAAINLLLRAVTKQPIGLTK